MKYNQSHVLYPEYYFAAPVERNFSGRPVTEYISSKFSFLYVISIIYIIVIFYGKQCMKERKPFQLKSFSFYWNTGLAIFSLWGFIRFLTHYIQLYGKYGFDGMICIPYPESGPFALASVAFGFSKILEFGDSFLLVMRKKPIIFLHWFHHVTVLLLAWHSLTPVHPIGRTFAIVNYFIHTVMYAYYAMATFGIRFPKIIPLCITSMQLAQMFFGIYTSTYSIKNCEHSDNSTPYWALIIYASYAVLFGNFFIQSYVLGKKKAV